MSSDWQRLATTWYRKREVWNETALWSDDTDRLHLSVVAGAPYGGPVATVRDEHVFQPVRGSLKPELQTWTSRGRPIASMPWPHSGLLGMGWTSQETLLCAFETGLVRTFTVMCEPINVFTVDGRIEGEGGAIQAALWPNGVAMLTKRLSLFVNASVTRSGDACHRCADICVPSPPLCLCVLPPPHEDSADIQVIVGTAEGPVLLVDRHESRDLGLDEGPYMAFAVSSSGLLLACLTSRGVFKVLRISDDLNVVDTANIECRKKPRQMLWCGDDCIALYLSVPTPSGGLQHVLFVGGPDNDWIPYQYDAPLHLVSEDEGFRILGTHKMEFVQRVPKSTEAIYSIGNCDPPAMLCYALERFEKGDVCAQESLRVIKDELEDAVSTCIDAARYEHDPDTVESLLNAAKFGRHFLNEPMDPKPFMETCRNHRICAELRKEPIDVPLTLPQLERLGFAGVTMRLAQRRQHLIAARICEWVGHPKDAVLFHWACEKIRHKKGSASTDEQLCEAILKKFAGCPGVGYAEVAKVAAEKYRPHLATMLLNHEPRGHAQVQVLLQLSREGEEENRVMMLRLAAEKAVQSCDPDLLHGVLSCACGGDPCAREASVQEIAKLISERPQQDLQMVGDVLAAVLQRNGQFDRMRTFHEQLRRPRHTVAAAYCSVMQVFQRREAEERTKWLLFAKDFFGHTDPAATEAERCSMQFCAQACSEEAQLLKAQVHLEEESVMKRWLNGPHRFAGLSLVDTLRKLIELGEVVEADNLHTAMKVSDKRYWRIKIRALSDSGNLSELDDLAKCRTSPIGYDMFIEAFLKHGRYELALPLVLKVKSPEMQAIYYSKMGMEDEAQAARARREERAGPGRFLQNFLGR